MKILLLALCLFVSGCAVAPLSLGTGHAATDIILGEFIREGAARIASGMFDGSWRLPDIVEQRYGCDNIYVDW